MLGGELGKLTLGRADRGACCRRPGDRSAVQVGSRKLPLVQAKVGSSN